MVITITTEIEYIIQSKSKILSLLTIRQILLENYKTMKMN